MNLMKFWEDPRVPHFIISISSIQVVFFILQQIAYYGEVQTLAKLLDALTSNSKKVRKGQVWRCVTHVLLHGSTVHLLMNLLMQVWFGWELETQFFEENPGMLALFYFLSAIGGDFLSSFFKVIQKTDGAGLGASGAVFGLESIWFIYYFCIYGWSDFMIFYLAYSVGMIGLAFMTQDGVDHWAHIGGIITAILCVGSSNLSQINSHTMESKNWLIITVIYHVLIIIPVFVVPHFFWPKEKVCEADVLKMMEVGIGKNDAIRLLKVYKNPDAAAQAHFAQK
jgi:membrane associated rhomboid family serine protease